MACPEHLRPELKRLLSKQDVAPSSSLFIQVLIAEKRSLASSNYHLNITSELVFAEFERLKKEIEEHKLRPPEIGGEAFLATKHHFEELINGRV
jgi:hypothetical protein